MSFIPEWIENDFSLDGVGLTRREAWLWMMEKAQNAETYRTRAGIVSLRVGQVRVGSEYLAEQWGWTRKRVRTFLRELEASGHITIDKSIEHQYAAVATLKT